MWELFADLDKVSPMIEVQTLEIIRSAKSGAIHLDSPFNLKDYAYSIKEREKYSAYQESKNKVPLLMNHPDDDGKRGSSYGITEERLQEAAACGLSHKASFGIQDMSPQFRREIAESELKHASRSTQLMGFDLWTAVRNTVKGYRPAVDALKNFLSDFPQYRPVVLTYLREIPERDLTDV